jgi:hypothetical protein
MAIRHGKQTLPWRVMRLAPFPLVVVLTGCSTSDLAEGVTQRTVRSLKIGMSVDRVIQIIGLPFYASYGTGVHEGSCHDPIPLQKFVPPDGSSIVATVDAAFYSARFCCNTEREQRTRGFTLEYSRKPNGPGSYPMLWVHFDENHRVRAVGAKVYCKYGLCFDHVTVYHLSAGDSLRSTRAGGDQQLFERFFPD